MAFRSLWVGALNECTSQPPGSSHTRITHTHTHTHTPGLSPCVCPPFSVRQRCLSTGQSEALTPPALQLLYSTSSSIMAKGQRPAPAASCPHTHTHTQLHSCHWILLFSRSWSTCLWHWREKNRVCVLPVALMPAGLYGSLCVVSRSWPVEAFTFTVINYCLFLSL